MELNLKIVGSLLIALSLLHVTFPKYFNWGKELVSLSLINRQMMYFHSFFIAFTVLLMGLLCLTSAKDIIETPVGRKIALGMGIFWTAGLIIQFFGYSSKTWKGKKLETIVHISFALLWVYFSTSFIITYLGLHN